MSKHIGPDLVDYARAITKGATDDKDRATILMHLIYEIESEWARMWRVEQKRQQEGAEV